MDNKTEKINQNSIVNSFVKTDDILKDMCGIIESSQKAAHQAVNVALVQRNWLIGYRIAEEELEGDERSEYGLEVIKKISKELTQRYGKGYDRSNLYHYLKFYKTFPEIVDTTCRQSGMFQSAEILDGTWEGICFCGKAVAYPYGEAGLLHRPRVLQLHTEMLCPHRPENRENHASRRRADGHVYPHV